MTLLKLPIVFAALLAVPACVPEPGSAEYDAYQRNKASREAVMYEGF